MTNYDLTEAVEAAVAKTCPVCLGYGYEREREGLE